MKAPTFLQGLKNPALMVCLTSMVVAYMGVVVVSMHDSIPGATPWIQNWRMVGGALAGGGAGLFGTYIWRMRQALRYERERAQDPRIWETIGFDKPHHDEFVEMASRTENGRGVIDVFEKALFLYRWFDRRLSSNTSFFMKHGNDLTKLDLSKILPSPKEIVEDKVAPQSTIVLPQGWAIHDGGKK